MKELLIYTPKFCIHQVMEKRWFFWELDWVYLEKSIYFSAIVNPFDKWYGTRALWHVILTVDVVILKTMTWQDIHHNFRNTQPKQTIQFRFSFFFQKQMTFVVIYLDNEDIGNFQWINKSQILSLYTQVPSWYHKT